MLPSPRCDYPPALVGTEKRDRQRAARLEKAAAEATAAKRERTKHSVLRIVIGAVVVLAVLFGVSQLMGDDGDSDDTETSSDTTEQAIDDLPVETTVPDYTNPELAEEVLGREPPVPEPPAADTPADALEATTLIEGEGEGAAAGDTVVVHYVGVLGDGSEFDQSWERGETFPVTLGQGQVITGWDEGLIGAKVGERRHLVIGSDNAYGPEGQGPIPPAAPLAFDVDVVDVQPAG